MQSASWQVLSSAQAWPAGQAEPSGPQCDQMQRPPEQTSSSAQSVAKQLASTQEAVIGSQIRLSLQVLPPLQVGLTHLPPGTQTVPVLHFTSAQSKGTQTSSLLQTSFSLQASLWQVVGRQ
ncbi:MAG: hypothetical protein QM765_32110 [Myxococcales bacterium]